MTAPRAYSIYLGHMRQAIGDALDFTANLDYEQFVSDRKTMFATVQALQILGEAAKRIPADIRSLDDNIPWRQMAGLRDVLIHDYDQRHPWEIWTVAT